MPNSPTTPVNTLVQPNFNLDAPDIETPPTSCFKPDTLNCSQSESSNPGFYRHSVLSMIDFIPALTLGTLQSHG